MGSNEPERLAFASQTEPREAAPPRPLPDDPVDTAYPPLEPGFVNLRHRPRPVPLADTGWVQGLDYVQGPLRALSALYRSHPSMESLLQTGARLVVEILGLAHCSIGWLSDNAEDIRVWTGHTRQGAVVEPARVHRVFAGLVNRLPPGSRPRRADSQIPAGSACIPNRQCELVSPLRIDNQIVGYVCGLKRAGNEVWLSDTEKSVFIALSQHLSAAIEAQRTREMLDSPYIALALTPREREDLAGLSALERPFQAPVSDPERLVRKIARRFCADLHRSGFEIKQILCVATELLDSLLLVQQASKPESGR